VTEYVTIFLCGDYTCKLVFDGTKYFLAFWWTAIPSAMTGPMQISFSEAQNQLCKEAYVPYSSDMVVNNVKASGPL